MIDAPPADPTAGSARAEENDENMDEATPSSPKGRPTVTAVPADPKRRVKVYLLEDDDRWVDKGTGQLSLSEHPTLQTTFLRVVSEIPPQEVLLECQIRPEIQYSRQEGTLIVWTELEPSNEDWAVSFQEAEGCDDIWNQIQALTRQSAAAVMSESDHSDDMLDDMVQGIPDPTIGNLMVIRDAVQAASRASWQRDALNAFVLQRDGLRKLVDVFDMLEDVQALEDLAVVFEIVKTILLLGGDNLCLDIVRDDAFFDKILGMLEYDPTVHDLHGAFRSFMGQEARFVSVVSCLPAEFAHKVKQVYRLQYLRDVALARYLDDPVFNVFTDVARRLNADLVRHLAQSQPFVDEMVQIFSAGHVAASADALPPPAAADGADIVERRRRAALFLKDLAGIIKQCALVQPTEVYATLFNKGLHRILRFGLVDAVAETRQATAEFITAALDVDRKLVQAMCLSVYRQQGTCLVHVLVQRLLDEAEEGLLQQLAETLKVLVEPESLPPLAGMMVGEAGATLRPNITPEYEAFQGMFYDVVATHVLAPLRVAVTAGKLRRRSAAGDTTVPVLTLPAHHVERVHQILELLHLMIRTNATRFKKLLFQPAQRVAILAAAAMPMTPRPATPLASQTPGDPGGDGRVRRPLDLAAVLQHLLLSSHKQLQLAALRIVRSMVTQADEEYARFLVTNQMLHGVVYVLLLTNGKYNLLNSAALELLDVVAAHGTADLSATTGGAAGALVIEHGASAPASTPHLRMLARHVARLHRYWPHLAYASKILDRLVPPRNGDDDILEEDDDDRTAEESVWGIRPRVPAAPATGATDGMDVDTTPRASTMRKLDHVMDERGMTPTPTVGGGSKRAAPPLVKYGEEDEDDENELGFVRAGKPRGILRARASAAATPTRVAGQFAPATASPLAPKRKLLFKARKPDSPAPPSEAAVAAAVAEATSSPVPEGGEQGVGAEHQQPTEAVPGPGKKIKLMVDAEGGVK
ncbi:Platinum sensitivity protein [Allomyces arbusculus]|nr:Platinum sensitivity protein [Allomyces arbusculus]